MAGERVEPVCPAQFTQPYFFILIACHFWEILEVFVNNNYDPVLNKYLYKIHFFQDKEEKLQVHYISHGI